jgi:hypothetical protein
MKKNENAIQLDSRLNMLVNQDGNITPAEAMKAALKIKADAEAKAATELALSRLNDASYRVERSVNILRDARKAERNAAKALKRVNDALNKFKLDGDWEAYGAAINARD